MATATASKPKAARTIVSTKVTSTGVEVKLAESVAKQFRGLRQLAESLKCVPKYEAGATEIIGGIDKIVAT